jgi:hypothetical protein
LDAFRQGLRDLGWTEGQNIAFEYRFAEGQLERLSTLAGELVRLKVDVILAGSTPGALAAKDATGTIPIVMVITGEPVASGLVASLARPGGNLTGVTALGQALSGKRLELLKEAVPGVTRVAVLANVGYPDTGPFLTEVEGVARALGVQLHVLEVHDPSEFAQAFAALSSERAGALLVGPEPLILIEAPSSADHCGLLSLGHHHSHEEETSCAFTPTHLQFTAASTCMPAPWTSVSCVRTARACCTGIGQRVPTLCSRPSRPRETIGSSPSQGS